MKWDLLQLIIPLVIIIWYTLVLIFMRERITKAEGYFKFTYSMALLFSVIAVISYVVRELNS